ncbi:MAG: DNA polymerase III subunit alpha [Pseudomonadota bacterium]
MPPANFVHLRVHSAYSLLEGALKIPEIIRRCRKERMPAVAVTDTNNLFGALEFSLAAAQAGVQPILGCQLRLANGKGGSERSERKKADTDAVVLLVQSKAGYRNLSRLVSRAYLETAQEADPYVSLEDLASTSEGLVALTGGAKGPVGRLLLDGQAEAAAVLVQRLAEIFPGRLYIEIQRHGLPEEETTESGFLELAYRYDLPLVATNEAFFADAAMFEAHDTLLCVAEGVHVADRDRRRLTPDHRFKSAEEMLTLYADLPEAAANTLVIAKRCAFLLETRDPILPAFPTAAEESEAAMLRRQATAGLERRLTTQVFTEGMEAAERERVGKHYRERLDYEIDVISRMGYPGYFLIVADFIQWAKGQGIPVGPGRGSGAGSVVAWSLTITDLDPLRFGLLFERFLNPERISMPDFDIDFCQERRDEVIRYVQEKYGQDRVAQIITFGTLQARAVLRDVGRVLGMPYGQVDRICKLIPYNPANPVSLEEAIEHEPRLQAMREEDSTVAKLLDIGMKLEGLYRHASTHAAGVVIGDRPLEELVPLYRDPRSNMPVTQFSMKYIESAGLVKFDFLGLKTLTVIARTLDFLKDQGIALDLSLLPLDDAKTYAALGQGDTVGVFQLESSGMRDVLKRLQPDCFEDIIALVALFRPGPMDNIPRYVACKHGLEKPDYLHALLEGILKETFGVIIYQEQVMQIAQVLSGFSLGAADLLRRAMGKKIKAEMEAQRQNFVEGAVAKGVPETQAAHIFEQVDKFAGYGFNKSHAAAYALVAYQTAYLKANYPLEFMAALMSLDLNNTDKLNGFRQELARLDISLLPPDVNRSSVVFTVERATEGAAAIRYALAALKNVGAHAMAHVIEERKAHGPFRNIFDFASRLDPRTMNKRQLESLVQAGAFDGLNPNRAQLFAAIDRLMAHANATQQARLANQASLFGEAADDLPGFSLPEMPEWDAMDRLRREYEAIGFYLSAHPLDSYAELLQRLQVTSAADLFDRLANGATERVRLAGTVIGKQERTSAKGNRFAFVQLSDSSGVYEIIVFSELLANASELLESGTPLLVTADARMEGEAVRMAAHRIEALDKTAAESESRIQILLRDDRPIAGLKALMAKEAKGRGVVQLILPVGQTEEVEMRIPGKFVLSVATREAIRRLPGVVEVRDG